MDKTQTQTQTEEMKRRDIGALWTKQSIKGQYFSGDIDLDGKRTKIVIFANGFKNENPNNHQDKRNK